MGGWEDGVLLSLDLEKHLKGLLVVTLIDLDEYITQLFGENTLIVRWDNLTSGANIVDFE